MSSDQAGITLVELILVVAAVAILALLITNLPQSVNLINKSRNLSIATDVASKQLNTLRKFTYSNLANGTTTFLDPALAKLANSQAVYEVEDCPVSVCQPSGSAKSVKVRVSWREATGPQAVELVTLVSDGGLGQ